MTTDDLIAKLRQLGTGASTDVLLTVDGEEYWEVALAFARIRHKGAEPYERDNDFPMYLVIHPEAKPL